MKFGLELKKLVLKNRVNKGLSYLSLSPQRIKDLANQLEKKPNKMQEKVKVWEVLRVLVPIRTGKSKGISSCHLGSDLGIGQKAA